MDLLSFFLLQHARVHSADMAGGVSPIDRVFGGLTDEQMRARPGKGVNSPVWLLWHMARTEDVAVNLVVTDTGQVLDDGWAPRLNVPCRHMGTGMTDDEVWSSPPTSPRCAPTTRPWVVGRARWSGH